MTKSVLRNLGWLLLPVCIGNLWFVRTHKLRFFFEQRTNLHDIHLTTNFLLWNKILLRSHELNSNQLKIFFSSAWNTSQLCYDECKNDLYFASWCKVFEGWCKNQLLVPKTIFLKTVIKVSVLRMFYTGLNQFFIAFLFISLNCKLKELLKLLLFVYISTIIQRLIFLKSACKEFTDKKIHYNEINFL